MYIIQLLSPPSLDSPCSPDLFAFFLQQVEELPENICNALSCFFLVNLTYSRPVLFSKNTLAFLDLTLVSLFSLLAIAFNFKTEGLFYQQLLLWTVNSTLSDRYYILPAMSLRHSDW